MYIAMLTGIKLGKINGYIFLSMAYMSKFRNKHKQAGTQNVLLFKRNRFMYMSISIGIELRKINGYNGNEQRREIYSLAWLI